MWREALGSNPLRNTTSDHNAWESELAKMHIFPQRPVDIWHCPDIFCPSLPPPTDLSLKGEQDQFACRPHYIMAATRLQAFDVSGMEANHDSAHVLMPYQTDYQAAVRLSSDSSSKEK